MNSTTASSTRPTGRICSPVRSAEVASSANGSTRCCPPLARPATEAAHRAPTLRPTAPARPTAALPRCPLPRRPPPGTPSTSSPGDSPIPSGTSHARVTGPIGAPSTRSHRPSIPRRPGRSTTRSVWRDRSPDSGWAWTDAIGRLRVTTSTSTPRSRSASRCVAGSAPDEASTSTACGGAATWRCCCCSTSRGRRPSRVASGAPCTSSSARSLPR